VVDRVNDDHGVVMVHDMVAMVHDVVAAVVNHGVMLDHDRPIGQQGCGGKGEERQEHSG
jgi:hypothetical protein